MTKAKSKIGWFPEVNIGIRIPRPACVTEKCLHYPVYILNRNVTGHTAFTDMQADIYITVGEGFWNPTFTPSFSDRQLFPVRGRNTLE